MPMPLRFTFRLALCGWLGLVGMGLAAAPVQGAAPIEKALPGTTIAVLKINNAADLRESLSKSQMGQLWADPAMKPVKDDLSSKLDEASKQLKDSIGITLGDLIHMPQGPVVLAVVGREGAKVPIALLVSADVGDKQQSLQDALGKATKLAEDKGEAKVSTESFKNLTLHVMRPTKEEDKNNPPLVWTNQGSVFHFSTDIDAIKDLVSHTDGRDDSLADSDSFNQIKKKVGEDAQILWFLDVSQGIKLVSKSANAGGGGGGAGNAQQIEAMLQVTGINGLKAIGGSSAFNSGHYDMVSKTFVLAPGPVQGLLKIFSMPATNLRPQPWVPATAASYESVSWDLDNAYSAINDLANMFNPGLLNVLEQQLAGPNGGEPLSFQKDIFGPLGDRITVVSDFKKKKSKEEDDAQRTLFAISLDDSKAFLNTLNKLLVLAKLNPKKREFQGTTIYDIEVTPPANAGAGNVQLKGTFSVAVAKDNCFISTEPTLLEQVLRSGGPRLADSPEFQSVAKEIPEQTSTMSYARPEEAIRQLYDMLKSGQFQKAFEQAAMAGGPDVPKLGNILDMNKLPEFSVISKYLSQSGGYGTMSEDGFYSTSFSLRKVNP